MNELCHWINQVLRSETIEEIIETLTEFGCLKWSLEDRSIMSSSYTPKLISMVYENNLEEKKYTLLEDCAALCWGSGS